MSDADNALLFVEIAQRGSIAAAAREFKVTRGTAARRLAVLEERLGVQLVHRTTRTLSLTSAGKAYLAHALEVRDALRRAEDAALSVASSPSGVLRIAAPIINTDRLLAPLLVAFDRAYPDIDVELALDADVRELVSGGFDVGLQVGLEYNSELVMKRLLVGEMILVGSPEYLERAGVPGSVEELDAHSCLMSRNNDGVVRPWPAGKGRTFMPSRVKLLSNSHDLVIVGTRAGLGLGMVPRAVIRRELEAGELVEVLPEVVVYQEWFSLVYSATRIVPPKVRAFVDFTTEYSKLLLEAGTLQAF